jgi:predicted ABC-type transport system involved in lysophospholipase L1 biosynthesis ATPase subunit
MTIITVTHGLEVAERAQRLISLRDGLVVEDTAVINQGERDGEL